MAGAEAIVPYQDHFGRDLSHVARDLESFAALLKKWQAVQNLVSRETLADVWTRHFADSIQLMPLLSANDEQVLDLGSGGGFPALPMAIASKGLNRHFTLVEPTSRKVSFLRTVARELELNVTVLGQRSDQIDSRETPFPNVITSRALAALPQLCAWMEPFFGNETKALLHKGREHVDEIRESSARWHHDVIVKRSDTDPTGVILTLTNLRRRSVS